MQTLGISDRPQQSDSRWKALFWPTIQNEYDVEYITEQGFWICFVVAALSLVFGALVGQFWIVFPEALFFFLAGVGVRQRSRIAAVAVFVSYAFATILLLQFSFGRWILTALLLANVRGTWLSARWRPESSDPPPLPISQTLSDRISGRMPIYLWPKAKWVFYVLAVLELSALMWGYYQAKLGLAVG